MTQNPAGSSTACSRMVMAWARCSRRLGLPRGTTLAVGAGGPTLADLSTTVIADMLPRPYSQHVQPRLQPAALPGARAGAPGRERWVWSDPFVQIVPARP